MTAPSIADLTAHPELTAFVPLLYVAWADGTLTDDEIRAVRDSQGERLPPVHQAALGRWLDPDTPPSSTELLRLFRFVTERASRLDASTRGSLVDLGLAIATMEGELVDLSAKRLALTEVESALGLEGSEVARELFVERPPVDQSFDEAAPDFDPAALTGILDGEYAQDWQHVRRLLRDDPRFRPVVGLSTDAYREQVLVWLRVLADAGLGALSNPVAHGGAGRVDRFVKTFEALAIFDLSLVVKLGVQFGLFGGAILNLGTERHHATYLPAVGRGELLGGFAMTELGHGSNVADLETVARYDVDHGVFVLHTPSVTARKEWIGNAAVHGRAMVVFAQLETQGGGHGVHAFMVPVRDEHGALLPGVSIEDCGHKMGLNGVDNGRLWFDHVQLPRDALLDRYGSVDADGVYDSPIASPARRFFTMLGTLVGGRVSVGSAAVTTSKTALAIAVRYGALRRQFGAAGAPERRILDYPSHQQRLLPHLASAYAHHFAMADLQRRWRDHDGDDTREIEALAAGLKASATWHAIDATQAAREACGGMGFLTVNRICQLRKDVDVFATFEGDNVVLLQLVAKSLLTGFGKQLSDNLVGALMKQVARRATTKLFEQNPVARRRTTEAHLDGADFHRDALRFRTHNLLVSAARRVKRRTDDGMDPFDAFVEVQDHLVSLALAHVDEHVHARFADAVEALDDTNERRVLERLRALFGVSRIQRDVGWFLENDYMDGSKARALRKRFGALCRELRPDAVALVNAFGIPDEILAAPIAFEDYAEHAMLARHELP